MVLVEGTTVRSRILFACALILAVMVALVLGGCQGKTEDSAGSNVDFEQAVAEDEVVQPEAEAEDELIEEPAPEVQAEDFSSLEAQVQAIVSRYDSTGADTAVTFELVGGRRGGFQINGEGTLAAASMIKLAVLATLFDEIEAGNISLDQSLTATSENVVGGAGTGISTGQTFTVRQLASKMISYSDNTASNMLVSLMGIDKINAHAKEMGLAQTFLDHKFMTPNPSRDNEISTNDLAKVLSLIAEDELGSAELSEMAQEFLLAQYDREALAKGLTGGMRLGNKTGSLAYARNDAGILFDPEGNPVAVLAVMTNNMGEGSANKMMSEIATAVCNELVG